MKYGKRMIPVKLHELTREASDVITRFKSHARRRRIWTFLCTSGTKSHSRSAKFKYTHIKQSSMIQRRGRLQTLIGYTCSHRLCIAQWASNWIYLSPVLSNIKEKTVTSLYFRYESYSRPTIHPTVTICILKNLPESPPRGGFVVSSVLPMV